MSLQGTCSAVRIGPGQCSDLKEPTARREAPSGNGAVAMGTCGRPQGELMIKGQGRGEKEQGLGKRRKESRGVSMSALGTHRGPFQNPGVNPGQSLNPNALGGGEGHYAHSSHKPSAQNKGPLPSPFCPLLPSPCAPLGSQFSHRQWRPRQSAPSSSSSRTRASSDSSSSPSSLSPVDLSRHQDSGDVTPQALDPEEEAAAAAAPLAGQSQMGW